jgi:hypothetical protein
LDRFIARDQNGQALAYVYFEEEPRRRSPSYSPATRPGASPPTLGVLLLAINYPQRVFGRFSQRFSLFDQQTCPQKRSDSKIQAEPEPSGYP